MNNSRSIIGILVVAAALLLSVWLGVSIVTSQTETLVQVLGGAVLVVCMFLGRRIWMIIPFLAALGFTLMIPGSPTALLLGQMLFLGFGFLLILMRKLPMAFQFTEIEFWMLVITLCIIQVYVRNPVGLNILGGGSVGGRPYVLFGVTLLSSWLLSSLLVPEKELRWIFRLSIIGGLMNFALSVIGYFVPTIGVWYGSAAAGQSSTVEAQTSGVLQAGRIGFLGLSARNFALWIVTKISPLKACFHPLWAPLVLISLAFAALSGYRNEMASVGLIYLVGLFYRGGAVAVIISCLGGIAMVAVLALVNVASPLPPNVQRSLSFLPGTWDESIVQGADDSTEWRVEMWKEALLTDYWIHNKFLGDGLGMSEREYLWMKSFDIEQLGGGVGSGKLTMQQEHMMITGSYHSGPVSAVRIVGYFGLLILLIAMFRVAVHGHRQILRCRGTEWYPLALLIGIPRIWGPIFFVFVFGEFPLAVSELFIGAAMIRLLEKNLPLPAYVKTRPLPFVLKSYGNAPEQALPGR